jgi:hypothetical protein
LTGRQKTQKSYIVDLQEIIKYAENRGNQTRDQFAGENRLLMAGLLSEYQTINTKRKLGFSSLTAGVYQKKYDGLHHSQGYIRPREV